MEDSRVGEPDLPALVIKAQKGDRPAFELIVRRTARIVYAQIVATVGDRQKAEDLAQETYVAAWNNLASVTNSSGFLTWLLTIARNTVLDAAKFDHRKKRAAPPAAGGPGEEAAAQTTSPSDHAELTEMRDRMLQMLAELPDDYRQPLTLRYLAGADYQTICRQLNLSDGALRGLLNRGMALLRERMTKQRLSP